MTDDVAEAPKRGRPPKPVFTHWRVEILAPNLWVTDRGQPNPVKRLNGEEALIPVAEAEAFFAQRRVLILDKEPDDGKA